MSLKLEQLDSTEELENEFKLDIEYYRSKYADLSDFSNDSLNQHWIEHGKKEGRFASLLHENSIVTSANITNDEEASEGNEFKLDISYYREKYSDIGSLDDEELNQHWLEHGRVEGRYASNSHEEKILGASLSSILGNDSFEPDFYISFYPDLHELNLVSDIEITNHYLNHGVKENRYPNLDAFLRDRLLSVIGEAACSFSYLEQLNAENGLQITKEQVLQVISGKPSIPVYFFSEARINARTYFGLAHEFLVQGAVDKGKAVLESSLYFDPQGEALELLGNIYKDQGHYQLAIGYYNSAKQLNHSKWLYLNLAKIYANLNKYEDALRILTDAINKYPEFSTQLSILDEISNKYWELVFAELMAYVDLGDRKSLIGKSNNLTKQLYDAYYLAFGGENNQEVIFPLNLERILIIGDYHIPQCERYRISQKVEQLEKAGKKVTTINWLEIDKFPNQLATHDVIIFYRTPATASVIKAIAQCNAAGKSSFYEVDDLIFTPAYPPGIESYGGYVDLNTYRELVRGMALVNSAARLCRYGIASTIPLKDCLAQFVSSGDCIVHRNGLDHFSEVKKVDRSGKKTIDVFYGSGTLAHNQDFIEIAFPAIEEFLLENSSIRLIIVGHLKLPAYVVERFPKQIRMIEKVSLQHYSLLLQQADINLAVLHNDEINACKSELKWFEAACFGIPSIVSGTGNYKDVVKDGHDAIIANNHKEWGRALRSLVQSRKYREKIGNAARLRVQTEYGIASLGASLANQIESICHVGSLAEELPKQSNKKAKIAIVNVFFPPQSIGGATRVVADNVSCFAEKYADNFDITIFTSDIECQNPHQLSVYNYQGLRVYRATVLFRENMDWHPKDENMYKLFNEFLECEKPDLIHFHCMQRLTGSVVQAALDSQIPYIVTTHDAWWISDFQFLVDPDGNVYPEGHAERDLYTNPEYPLPENVSFRESNERYIYLLSLLYGAKSVLTVSNNFADIYKKNGVYSIQVTMNGVSSTQPWAPKNTVYSPRVVAGQIGGMSNHKGFDILKKSVLEVQPNNIEFLVVDHSKEEGYEYRDVWGVVPVTYIGRVNQSRIVELYQKLDVLFAPSIWPESFGLVTREASACGCWVVASNLGGIGEDVVTGENGYVIEPSQSAINSVLIEIDSFPAKYKQLAAQTKLNTSDQQAQCISKIYMDLLND